MFKKKILTALLILIVLVAQVFVIPVSADNAKISLPSSANIGNTIEVTVTFECTNGSKKVGAVDATLAYDSEYLECTSNPSGTNIASAGNCLISYFNAENTSAKLTKTFKFKTKKVGTTNLSIKNATVTDTELTKSTPVSDSKSIKIIDKSTLPGNANASKISPSSGKLVPSFSPSVTSYNINIDYSVTELLLSVTAEDAKAGIEVEGSKNMKVGANTRTVVITAQNGTKKKYTINIYRAAAEGTTEPTPPVVDPSVNIYEVIIDGAKKYLAKDYEGIEIPTGYSPAVQTIGEHEVPVLKDVVGGKTVVYVTDEAGQNGEYYLYSATDNAFTPFRYVKTLGQNLLIVDYSDKVPTLSNYYYTVVNVGGYTVNGFKYNDAEMTDFAIFYAENDNGEKLFYRYDIKDKTIQRAVEFTKEFNAALSLKEQGNKTVIARFMDLETKNKIILISGLVVVLVLFVLIIVLIVKLVNKPRVSIESLEAKREQEFMDGFGENKHLFLNDDSVLDDDFKLKDNND